MLQLIGTQIKAFYGFAEIISQLSISISIYIPSNIFTMFRDLVILDG